MPLMASSKGKDLADNSEPFIMSNRQVPADQPELFDDDEVEDPKYSAVSYYIKIVDRLRSYKQLTEHCAL